MTSSPALDTQQGPRMTSGHTKTGPKTIVEHLPVISTTSLSVSESERGPKCGIMGRSEDDDVH